MAKKLDLTGQRCGKLTVLRPAENVGGRTAWVCRCDCGQETIVQTASLQSSHTKSCGCLRFAALNQLRSRLTYVDGTCVEEIIKNKKMRRNNTSGATGVEWMPCRRRWKASICFKGKIYFLGYYYSFENAVKARKQAEKDLHDKFFREFNNMQTQAANGCSYVQAKEDG